MPNTWIPKFLYSRMDWHKSQSQKLQKRCLQLPLVCKLQNSARIERTSPPYLHQDHQIDHNFQSNLNTIVFPFQEYSCIDSIVYFYARWMVPVCTGIKEQRGSPLQVEWQNAFYQWNLLILIQGMLYRWWKQYCCSVTWMSESSWQMESSRLDDNVWKYTHQKQ